MLYGRPTKHVRHVDHDTFTLEPQRFRMHLFWQYAVSGVTSRSDGQDLQDDKLCPLGSKITKHKVDMLVTPETIEPQQIYMGRVKLSFNDVYSTAICGGRVHQASYQDTATENFAVETNAITPHLFPYENGTGTLQVAGGGTTEEIGGSGSGYGIAEWLLDDNIKHWINAKKLTVFDQRPLMGSKWQRIPAKVKRINEGTLYGLWIFNDSPRGATPADTQVTIDIKSYWEELAL